MRSKLIYAAAAPAAMAAAALVAACGGSSPSSSSSSTPASSPSPTAVAASQVLPKMEAAVKAAKSVHMSGKAPNGSQHVTFDVSFFGKSGVAGSVGENGESFYILSESGRTFIKINAGFLKVAHAPASACATVCGKYVELPASEAKQITGSFTLPALASQVFSKLPSAGSAAVMFTPATAGGQQVLQWTKGKTTVSVAATGTPYPLVISDNSGDSVNFTQWNAVTAPALPPASKIINISQL